MRRSGGLLLSCTVLMITLLPGIGCGGRSDSVSGPTTPLAIYTQPKDASVPMGLAAAFSVGAWGTGLQYQWLRDGVAIAGANGSSYTTPATSFSDDGEGFSVEVRSGSGVVRSAVAHLTVTARAPLAGDLRFQQVDAPSTVNGWNLVRLAPGTIACGLPGQGAMAMWFEGTAFAFPLWNAPCTWNAAGYADVAGGPAPTSAYEVGSFAALAANLNQPPDASLPSAADPGSVVTAIGLVPSSDGVAFGYVHVSGGPAYTLYQADVSAAQFADAAAAECSRGYVITAFYVNGTRVHYFAYGWAGDPQGVYETSVVSGSLGQVDSLVKTLAAGGYIVTATGSTQAEDGSGVWIVGTRLRGDTLPRPVLVEDSGFDQLQAGGYALVAPVLQYGPDGYVFDRFVGER